MNCFCLKKTYTWTKITSMCTIELINFKNIKKVKMKTIKKI